MSLADRLLAARQESQEANPEAEKWEVRPDEMPVAPEPTAAKPDFSDQLSALMRAAGNEKSPEDSAVESDPFAPIGAETSAPASAVHVENTEGKLASLRRLNGSAEASDTKETFTSPHDPTRELTYEQLMREMATPASERDALYADQTSVTTATSRIGRLLQRAAARAENGANRADRVSELTAESKEYAKTKLRGAGRAALRASKATAEVASRTATAAGEFSVGVGTIARDKAEDVLNNTLDAVGGAIEKKVTNLKEALVARKEAAQARRQARRERWSQRWTSTKESVKNGYDKSGDALMSGFAKLETGADVVGSKMVNAKDKLADKAERARASAAATRAIGRAAIDARRMGAE